MSGTDCSTGVGQLIGRDGVQFSQLNPEDTNMRWKGRRKSQNVEDRRGMRVGRGAAVGGVGGIGFLIIVVLYLFLGGDPSQLMEQMPQAGGPSSSTTAGPPPAGQDTPPSSMWYRSTPYCTR